MPGLISDRQGDVPREEMRIDAIYVDGRRYANAAAKFWPSLVDEVREDFPLCSSFTLGASTPGSLNTDQLFPHLTFQKQLEQLATTDWKLEDVIEDALAETLILGPPTPVLVHLYSDDQELLSRELPRDRVDAEIFPFLLVWMLEWAGIPATQWNNKSLAGAITADDKKRHITYSMNIKLKNRHLSEGLYDRSILVRLDSGPDSRASQLTQ